MQDWLWYDETRASSLQLDFSMQLSLAFWSQNCDNCQEVILKLSLLGYNKIG
jgi:hypothetical protein